jgi:hypothetical protein
VSGNKATHGGGIWNSDTANLFNSAVSDNDAQLGGGGIENFGTLTLTSSRVSGNTTFDGGGIDNGGTLTVTSSTVSGNTASFDGGGIRNDVTLTVTNSTVSGNSSGEVGGGIFNFDGTLTLTSSTVSGNKAKTDGGGIWNSNTAAARVFSSTITNNQADADFNGSGIGGGVFNSSAGVGETISFLRTRFSRKIVKACSCQDSMRGLLPKGTAQERSHRRVIIWWELRIAQFLVLVSL